MAASKFSPSTSPPTKCKRCTNHYDDPRMLPCLHSYCNRCISQLVIQTGSKKTIHCPTCYNTTPPPLKGVDSFPQNVRLSYETTITKYEAQITSKIPPSCDECDREPALETVSFCCTGCGFLCTECHMQHIWSKRLKSHIVIGLKETRGNVRKLLKQHIPQPPITCTQHPEKNVEMFCTDCNELVCMQCALIQHHGHKFEELSKLSQKKKVKIKKSLKTLPESVTKLEETIVKGTHMKKQIKVSKKEVDDKIRKAFKELREELDKREKALLAKSEEIATAKESSLSFQLEELTSVRDQIVTCTMSATEVEGSYKDTELLSIITTLQTCIQELTQLFDKAPLELSEDDSVLLTMETKTLKKAINKFGSVTKPDYKTLNQPVKTSASISCQPRVYKNMKQPVLTLNFDSPYYVAVQDNEDIVVPNNSDHSVNVFDKYGYQKLSLGRQQHHALNGVSFNSPTGVAISGDVFFVTEYHGGTVKKMTMTGELLLTFGMGKLANPQDCAVSSNGMIYVADYSKNRVKVFNSDGTFSHDIGSGQISFPMGIAIDKCKNIHVTSKNVIKVFTENPNIALVREYGKGVLNNPQEVAVDKDGYCLVGNYNSKSVCIFDPRGKLVHTIHFPSAVCGVTLDKDGHVYVVECGGNKVHKY